MLVRVNPLCKFTLGVALLGGTGCTERTGPQEVVATNKVAANSSSEQRAPSGAAAPTNANRGNDAISCNVDSDCPVLACGPCTPELVITKALLDGPDCSKNPCKNGAPYCNAKHVCAVHPSTVSAGR